MPRALLLSLGAFGIPSLVLTIYPSVSQTAFMFAMIVSVPGIGGSVWGIRTRNWWGQMAFGFFWPILFLGMAIRAWAYLAPPAWIWIFLLGLAYAFVWLLPAIYPRLSAVIAREQLAPETAMGRGCFTVAIAILPAAAGLGAAFGLAGGQFVGESIPHFTVAILATVTALAAAQLMAHQLWPKRPWAQVGQ